MDAREVLREILEQGPEFKYSPALEDGAPLMESGVADSFDMITLVVRVQERFGIEIEPDDLTEERFRSIASIAAFIATKVRPPAGG